MSAGGGLASADGRETQVRRLLGHADRAAIAWCAWCASGSGVDRIAETAKDTTVYTRFTPAARTSMDTETKKFIDEVVQNSTGTVGELLSANWSIVDSTLAPIYGVTSAGATAHTMLPKRLGILNQAAFLSVFAHAQETAPVLRGVAVMRRVACMKLPDPQSLNIQSSCRPRPIRRSRRAIASTSTPPTPRAPPATARSTQIGFAFEMFDGMGAQRAGRHGGGHVQGRAPRARTAR